MPLETASTIAELNENNPVGASDTPASLDDHIQLIKKVLKADALVNADIGVAVQAYDSTILKSANIGSTVQAYDADTAKLDVAQTWTANQSFNANALVISPTSKIGYSTGAGGTVTQSTSKSTAVTLHNPSGQITMNNAELAAGATVSFTLNNSLLGLYDCFSVGVGGGGSNPDSYSVRWRMGGGGAVVISVTNTSGLSLSEAIVLNFAVIKGSAS